MTQVLLDLCMIYDITLLGFLLIYAGGEMMVRLLGVAFARFLGFSPLLP